MPGGLSFQNFMYGYSYDYGDFLNGKYTIAYPINVDMMWYSPADRQGHTMTG